HVEFLPSHHAVENLASRFERDAIEGEARGDHIPLADRVHPIVTAQAKVRARRDMAHLWPNPLTRRRVLSFISADARMSTRSTARLVTDAILPPGPGANQPLLFPVF